MLRCTWCFKDTKTKPCEHCESDMVFDPYQEHTHEWSRKTFNTVACKVCDLEVPNDVYFSGSAPATGKKEKPKDEVQSGAEVLPERSNKDRGSAKGKVKSKKDAKRKA